MFILCVIYQNLTDIDPWGVDRLKSLVLAYLTQTSDTGHMTHKNIEPLNALPSYQCFYFAQQIIYKSIDFIFLCMLVVYEWVCKYVSEINDWNCT